MSAIEKQRHILDFTLSSLWRRKGKNISLVVVYTFVIFLLASVLFFADAIKKEAALILQDAPEMMVQRLVAGRQDLIPIRLYRFHQSDQGGAIGYAASVGILLRRPERRQLYPDGQCGFKEQARRDHHRQRRDQAE